MSEHLVDTNRFDENPFIILAVMKIKGQKAKMAN